MPTLVAAGNTEVPAYLVLRQKGYAVRRQTADTGEETWFAEREGLQFLAGGPLELLGVVALYEVRGEAWRASDEEIEAFLVEYIS